MATTETEPGSSGLLPALGAYVIWGLMPLYLILVREVPAFEFVGWRILWTLPLCLLIVAIRKQTPQLRVAFATPKVMLLLLVSATLIAVNWVVYVWAIQQGNVYAASLGYYINPLINVLLGTLLLREKLSKAQWVAVALAGLGVSLLAAGALTTLWISLTLALSFGTYGIIRKQVDVGALPGLTIESILLTVPAAAVVWYYAGLPEGSSFGSSIELSTAIMLGGALTAFPLLLFAIAARKLPYSILGFIQFLAPSIVFILGLTVFGEELLWAQAACFACIWIAAAIFVWDLWSRSRAPAAS